jgi:hypothetical protein
MEPPFFRDAKDEGKTFTVKYFVLVLSMPQEPIFLASMPPSKPWRILSIQG